MNVVLYLRYSSDKQTEQSIEGQQRVCSEYCKHHDMNIISVYIDRALSASKNIEKRESFLQMIKDSEKRSFEGVVVYKLDRFARNRYDSATYKNKLKKNGVRVISATENISDNPEGIILESVLEGMAEFYSRELSQKVSRGMNETALKGNSCGGSIPFGYRVENKKLVIDPAKAPLVKEIFTRYASGERLQEIAEDLNSRGIRTTKNTAFNKNTFHTMLQNEKYIGIYKYKDIRIENGIPAIIDAETFKTVQNRVNAAKLSPRKTRATVEYLLSQKLFCGHCGNMMTGEYGTSKNRQRYYYYSCTEKRRTHTCDKKNVAKDTIEKIVTEDAVSLLTPQNIKKLADAAVKQAEKEANINPNIKAIRKELAENEKSIANLLKLVERGSTSESLFNRLEELERIKEHNIKRLAEAEADIVKLDREQVIWWLSKFSQGDPNSKEYQRRVIDLLVNSVTIWDEPDGYKITVAYNLTSIKAKTFKCSTNGFNDPPKKEAKSLT